MTDVLPPPPLSSSPTPEQPKRKPFYARGTFMLMVLAMATWLGGAFLKAPGTEYLAMSIMAALPVLLGGEKAVDWRAVSAVVKGK